MTKKTVILVVEDEAIIRMGAVQMLEEAGFSVVEASNAHDALGILENRTDVRAIFTDIHMPGTLDGLRLARMVRGRWPPIHLIVTSGLLSPNEDDLPPGGKFVRKAAHAGVSAFLLKPITPAALAEKLKGLMELRVPAVKSGSYHGPDRRRRTTKVRNDRRAQQTLHQL